MSQPASKHRTYRVDLPEDLVADAPEEVSRRLRLLWVLDAVRRGTISAARGGELLGLSRFDMYDLMARHGLSLVEWDAEELARELSAATRLAR